jgi:PleD family two-component response regulator
VQSFGKNQAQRRVLLVGARDTVRPEVRKALSGSGWDLRIAAFAPGDDLRPWFQERPDVVVVDGIGTGSGVFTMLGKLREFDADRDIPFVALVDDGAPEIVTGAYDQGAADVLTAPLEPARIADRVQFQVRSAQVVGSFHTQLEELLHAQRLGGTGSWTLGVLSGLIRWSAEAERILGLGEGRAPRDLEALLGILPEDDR